jgi:hypothetical protein
VSGHHHRLHGTAVSGVLEGGGEQILSRAVPPAQCHHEVVDLAGRAAWVITFSSPISLAR